MKTKKTLILGLAVLLAVCFGTGGFNAVNVWGADIPEALYFIPDTTEMVLKIGSLEKLYQRLSVKENSFFGFPLEDLEDVKGNLGFNPFSLKDLKDNGFDTGNELGIFINDFKLSEEDGEPRFSIVFFFPVLDAQKVMITFRSLIEKEFPQAQFNKGADMTTFVADDDLKGYFYQKDNFLFVGINPDLDGKTLVDSYHKSKNSLLSSKKYYDVSSKIESRKDIFLYADLQKVINNNLYAINKLMKESEGDASLNMNKTLEYLRSYASLGLAVDLDERDLNINSVVNIVPNSEILEIMKNMSSKNKLLLKIKESPVLMLAVATNIQKYYESIIKTVGNENKAEFDQFLMEFKENIGVDLESDIIAPLSGDFSFGMFDGISISMVNYNTVFALGLKDTAKMKSTLNAIVAKLPPENQSMINKADIEGNDTYVINLFGMVQLYVSVVDPNLIISLGKPMFEKILAAQKGTGWGFVKQISDSKLKDNLTGDNNFFYLNMSEGILAAKNFAALSQQMMGGGGPPIDNRYFEPLAPIQYIMSYSKLNGNTVYGDFTIKTSFKDTFLDGVRDIVQQYQQLAMESMMGPGMMDDDSGYDTTSPDYNN